MYTLRATPELGVFEWDEWKRGINLAAHGIDFEDAIAIWEDWVLEFRSSQGHHSGERFLAIGKSEDRIITVGKRRLISARAARRNERKNYDQAIRGQAER